MAVVPVPEVKTLDLKLGQVPGISVPEINYELQGVYNAIHILNQYLQQLAVFYQGTDSQKPSESLRFRSTMWIEAGTDITAGEVVSQLDNKIVKGVQYNYPGPTITGNPVPLELSGLRSDLDIDTQCYFIALNDAKEGELVQCGVGPGVLEVTGSTCGEVAWGAGNLSILCTREANTASQIFSGQQDVVGDGTIYIGLGPYSEFRDGPVGPANYLRVEEFQMPGFPFLDGGVYFYNYVILFPIGICIADGFILFSDYISQLTNN